MRFDLILRKKSREIAQNTGAEVQKPAKCAAETQIRQAQRGAVPLDKLKGSAPAASEMRGREATRLKPRALLRQSVLKSVHLSAGFFYRLGHALGKLVEMQQRSLAELELLAPGVFGFGQQNPAFFTHGFKATMQHGR